MALVEMIKELARDFYVQQSRSSAEAPNVLMSSYLNELRFKLLQICPRAEN